MSATFVPEGAFQRHSWRKTGERGIGRELAERVGFGADSDGRSLSLQTGRPPEPPPMERQRRKVAERVGFEPTCRLPDKTLSRRPRYDHFGTSPGGSSGLQNVIIPLPRAVSRRAAARMRAGTCGIGWTL